MVALLGILANIALPVLRGAVYKADAATVISDFKTIHVAAMQRYADEGTYPSHSGWGQVPPDLADYLPANFDFRYKSVDYRWRAWPLPNGRPNNPRQRVLVGVEVRTNDRALLSAVKNLYSAGEAPGRGNQLTFVIE